LCSTGLLPQPPTSIGRGMAQEGQGIEHEAWRLIQELEPARVRVRKGIGHGERALRAAKDESIGRRPYSERNYNEKMSVARDARKYGEGGWRADE